MLQSGSKPYFVKPKKFLLTFILELWEEPGRGKLGWYIGDQEIGEGSKLHMATKVTKKNYTGKRWSTVSAMAKAQPC